MASHTTSPKPLSESPDSPERHALTPTQPSSIRHEPLYPLPAIEPAPSNALYNANITISALQERLATSERHARELGATAAQDAARLDYALRCSRAREAQLEHDVTYLSTEVEKANEYNRELNSHIRFFHVISQQQTIAAQQMQEQRMHEQQMHEQQMHEQQMHEQQLRALQEQEPEGQEPEGESQKGSQTAVSTPKPAPAQAADDGGDVNWEEDSAAPTKKVPPAQDSKLLLAHNQNIIRTLRAEIRALKAKRAELERRLAGQW